MDKNVDEAFRLNWDMRAKNSLDIECYGLENFINLMFHGWTVEDIGKAFKRTTAEIEQIMEKKQYGLFKEAVMEIKNENKRLKALIEKRAAELASADKIIYDAALHFQKNM